MLALPVLGLALVIDRFGQRDRARPAQAIVVLGARVLEGGVASAALRARAEHGAELYLRGLAPLVVFSGGVGAHPPSEAAAARAIAIAAGVPAAACLLEDESHSTRENARNTARLLRARGVADLVVVSDPSHLFRARAYFRQAGLEVATSPALASARNRDPLERAYWTLREAFALVASPSLLWTRAP